MTAIQDAFFAASVSPNVPIWILTLTFLEADVGALE
jgi:hypothetical protein